MSYTSITNIGTRHSDILRGLDFYRQEIKILEQRLFEVASKNNGFEARQGIEHFQNQFVIQHNNLHHLKHRLDLHIGNMSKEALAHAGHVDRDYEKAENDLVNEYEILEKIVKELRQEFQLFLSKWM